MEENLEKLRKKYTRIKPPTYLKEDGWHDLQLKLEPKNSKKGVWSSLNKSIIFASICGFFVVGTVGLAQAATSEENPLYPIKQFTDQLIYTVLEVPKSSGKKPKPTKSPLPTVSPTTIPTHKNQQKEASQSSSSNTPKPSPKQTDKPKTNNGNVQGASSSQKRAIQSPTPTTSPHIPPGQNRGSNNSNLDENNGNNSKSEAEKLIPPGQEKKGPTHKE